MQSTWYMYITTRCYNVNINSINLSCTSGCNGQPFTIIASPIYPQSRSVVYSYVCVVRPRESRLKRDGIIIYILAIHVYENPQFSSRFWTRNRMGSRRLNNPAYADLFKHSILCYYCIYRDAELLKKIIHKQKTKANKTLEQRDDSNGVFVKAIANSWKCVSNADAAQTRSWRSQPRPAWLTETDSDFLIRTRFRSW